ncbi:unnamed protein product [Meganyctiphanes norvegica]|uniref:Uncharacterized protein n=1 Tax=Meganyctiphanes norvegica TaxID=48144 RepID=A0AAV2RZ13_MEGNR
MEVFKVASSTTPPAKKTKTNILELAVKPFLILIRIFTKSCRKGSFKSHKSCLNKNIIVLVDTLILFTFITVTLFLFVGSCLCIFYEFSTKLVYKSICKHPACIPEQGSCDSIPDTVFGKLEKSNKQIVANPMCHKINHMNILNNKKNNLAQYFF